MRSAIIAILAFVLLISAPTRLRALAQAQAQAPNGTLTVTIVDSTGAVLPGATVTVKGIDATNTAATIEPVKASAEGVATVARLAPGRYSVEASFDGFDTKSLPDVRVRNGNNKQVLMLPIAGVKQSVTVSQDKQTAAADPRGSSFGTVLTREQLEALSDDPQVLAQQLQEMAGPGAVIKVDSFEGGALPSKAQIRSIRISRDQFAAEYHSAGGISIEIITQPGMGPLRMNMGARLRGDSLTGRSPFVPVRGPEQFRSLQMGANGTLVKNKSSFGVFFFGNDAYDTPNLNVALGGGRTRSEALGLKAPRRDYNVNANVDYAVTLDQTLRFGFFNSHNNNKNQGIGQYDTEDRAYARDNTNGSFRAQQIGPLGRRGFLRTRLGVNWSDSDSHSSVELITIRVNDAFNSGGAQIRGGQYSRTFTLGSDLDYVRGINSLRGGFQFDGGRYRSDDASNYLGTYTFESLDAYLAAAPRSFTRRIGDPNLKYDNLQGAIYFQDDMRVRRNLTLSAGARYEAQTHISDYNNIMPRFGITWSPFKSGLTTLRTSWGIFNDWFSTGTYEQTLRVDGFRQQELDIVNPSYPSIGTIAFDAAPGNKYLLGNARLSNQNRASVGVDQRYKTLQMSATYAFTRGGALARGQNLNAPVNRVRPDARFGNIVEVVSDAHSRLHQLQLNASVNTGALLPIQNARNAPRVSFKRVTVFYNYTLASQRNNTDGAFSLAPTGNQEFEWGPANGDVRHRMNVALNNQIVKNLTMGLNVNFSTGVPYTIRTGRDDNGDLVFNDRPAGIGRNTERAANQWTLNANLGYGWTFGPPVAGPAGIGVIFNGASADVRSIEQGKRFRLQFFVNAQNLTNRHNYTGYSGTLTSPFYGRPTSVAGVRRVDTGFNFGF